MKTTAQLIEELKEEKIDGLEFQRAIFQNYKNSDRTEEDKQEVFEVIKRTKELNLREDVWTTLFHIDRAMFRQIDLLQTKMMAEKSFNRHMRDPDDTMLKMAASLAYAYCSRSEIGGYDNEKEDIWNEVFSSVPKFNERMNKEKMRSAEILAKSKEQYKEYFDGIAKEQSLPIVASYEVSVPMKLNSNDFSLWMSPEITILINEIKDSFNNLGLESYMESFEKKCNKSVAEYNHGFTFRFDCYQALTSDELVKAKDEFRGQLSDGWGDGASQKRILIGKEDVTVNFMLEELSDFNLVETKKKNLTP